MERKIFKVTFLNSSDSKKIEAIVSVLSKKYRKLAISNSKFLTNVGYIEVSNPTTKGIEAFEASVKESFKHVVVSDFAPWKKESLEIKDTDILKDLDTGKTIKASELPKVKAYNPFDLMKEAQAEPITEDKKERNVFKQIKVLENGFVLGYFENASYTYFKATKDIRTLLDKIDDQNGQKRSVTLIGPKNNKLGKWIFVFRSEAIKDGYLEAVKDKYNEYVEAGKKKAEENKQKKAIERARKELEQAFGNDTESLNVEALAGIIF